ncbi:MAG: hypothetical protein H7839_24395 [Magnetococcus sp. YQC-5]
MDSKNVLESRLLGITARLKDLSKEMNAVGWELIECGYLQGNEMVGAGEIAGEWAKELVKEIAKK